MGVVREAVAESWRVVEAALGGTAERGSARPAQHRGALWLSVQVLGVAVVLAGLVVVRDVLGLADTPGWPEQQARLGWAVPALLLLVPLVAHGFARPPRAAVGLLAALAAAAVVIAVLLPLTAAAPAAWAGLLTLTPAALTAGVVYGLLSPVGTPREA